MWAKQVGPDQPACMLLQSGLAWDETQGHEMPRVAQPHGAEHTGTHSESESQMRQSNSHKIPHKIYTTSLAHSTALLYAQSHTGSAPLHSLTSPMCRGPHPTPLADSSLASIWKLLRTGFVLCNKAPGPQVPGWIHSIHLSPPPSLSSQNKRKLSFGKWMLDVGAQRKSFRDGRERESE